jgi:uncharacterized NAD(P)/FAD-binding protein YdhS
MIDHKKIEDAIDSYFKNTPTAKIIENLDRLSADREKDLDRENINHKTANSKDSIIGNLVKFEEVSPANQDAAFLAVSIKSLVAPIGLPLYEGYDDLDEMWLTFLTLPSGETVTLMEYLHSPQPGVCICVDAKIQNIPQVVFESCQQLQVSREEAIWFHPDWQEEIDRLYAEHGAIEKRPESSQLEELKNKQYEPIDCFNHALRIYTREYVPATYWAMLQHNLGLAYFNRNQGDRRENLERSIECFNKSLEIYTQDEFPEKWKINQDDLSQSQLSLEALPKTDIEYLSLAMLPEGQSDLSTLECYDIAIVGAGISSAYTLIHYMSQLERQATIKADFTQKHLSVPTRIVVTEKSGEFWAGIPYGCRSGRNTLLVSPLHEFIPQQQERQNFIDWLTFNRDRIFNSQEYNQGELSCKWLQDNQEAMSQGLWDDLFIPRSTFGLYIQERITQLIATATAKGLIEFKLITAEVVDVQNIQDNYQVDLAGKEHTSFLVKQLVLAIGSSPNIAFEKSQSSNSVDGACYINNMYEPSLDFNIDRICESLSQSTQSQRQVLMIGSSAGTLDTLYSINNSQVAVDLIDKFIVISPNAAFPYRISKGIIELNYKPQHLLDLVESAYTFTAKEMFITVKQDVAAAIAQNINVSDINGDISKIIMWALSKLNPAEQKQFVIKYAVEIGKYLRRAGSEYLDVVNNLVAQHKLELIKGRFTTYSSLTTGGYRCEYIDSDNGTHQVLDNPIRVIINCAGLQDVTKSSSILIQNLIRRNICIPNESNRGFIIDKNFKANYNFYIMGPLVAGNIDGDFKIWHAESCQRIISLSERLAATLLESEQGVSLESVSEMSIRERLPQLSFA